MDGQDAHPTKIGWICGVGARPVLITGARCKKTLFASF